MLAKARDGYTEAQVESALAAEGGAYELQWRFELLDKYRNTINSDLTSVESGRGDWVRSRRIRGGAQFVIRRQEVELDDYDALVLQSAPLFYLKLSEPSGTTAEDISGNNRDGTYQNTPTLNVASLLAGDPTAGAVRLNGTDEYVSVASDAAFNTTAQSLEIWFTAGTAGGYQNIATRSNNSTQTQSLLRITPSGYLEVVLYVSGGTAFAQPLARVTDGEIYHAVWTYDGSFLTLYLNGDVVKRVPETRAFASVTQAFEFGRRGDNLEYLNGVIARAAVYGAALPAPVVRAHYQAGSANLYEVKFGQDRIKTVCRMRQEDGGWAEFPRGEWILGFPVEPEEETGDEAQVLAFDKLKMLDDLNFSTRRVYAAGSLYTDCIILLLAEVFQAGEFTVSTTSTATLPSSIAFDEEENYLDAINRLATAISYDNAYTNAEGMVVVEEWTQPVNRTPDDTIDVDSGRGTLLFGREVSTNLNDTKNTCIVVSTSPKNGTKERAIVKLEDAEHPAHQSKVGRRSFVYNVVPTDSGTLPTIGRRELTARSAFVERVRERGGIRPFYENDEIISIKENGITINYWLEELHTPWGSPPFTEEYVLNRVR